ncbi:MAG: 30S ribosomal protein S1 [Desulfobacterium sp.]|nr:30S ribosomal protein S1 [Desulfobacterium sp.]
MMADKFGDNGSDNQEEASFAEMFASYDAEINHDIRQGDKIEGKIISIGQNAVYISTGSKSDGVVDKAELLDKDGQFNHAVGDMISLYVVSKNESEITLSKSLSGAGTATMLEDASYTRTPVEGKVAGTIKGGFNVTIMGKRAFCPVSQMDIKYVEDTESYVGSTFDFLITRFEEGGRNIVVSRRDLLNLENKDRQDAFFKEAREGEIVTGSVTKLMPYGAFIELVPGVEGMAHISELSWSRVDKAEEVLAQGETVKVKILKIEAKEGVDIPKISLSIKQALSEDPWDSQAGTIAPGDQLTGKVVRLAPFGAFVEIAPGMDGLVHLSEMSHTRRIVKADDVVTLGEMIQVVVKDVDIEKRRISLSIKDALGDPWTGIFEKYAPGTIVETTVEKKEQFGIFLSLEPGVTGLLPASVISKASKPSDYESLKPGDKVTVMVESADEERRRISLAPPEMKDSDEWRKFAAPKKEAEPMGDMGTLLMEALKNKK